MRVLNRYIAWHVITSILIVSAAFIGIVSFIHLLQEMRVLGQGDYFLLDAMYYTLLVLPSSLYDIFPIIGLIGSLFGLSMLATRNEIVAMQASGVSYLQLVWSVMKAGIIVVLAVSVMGESIAPKLQDIALNYKTTQTSSGRTYRTYDGTWVRSANNFVHINKISNAGYLTGITQYAFNENGEMYLARQAKEALYQNESWLLKDVEESLISTEQVVRKEYDELVWDVNLTLDILTLASIKSDQLSLFAINAYIKQLKSNGLDASNFELIFWQRIFRPLAIAVMLFLAIPFIFGAQRSTKMGGRMAAGILIGAIFYVLNEFLGPFSLVYQIPAFIASLIPIVLFFMIGYILLLRRT